MTNRPLTFLAGLVLLALLTWLTGGDRVQFAQVVPLDLPTAPLEWEIGKSTGEFSVADGALTYDGEGGGSQIHHLYSVQDSWASSGVQLRVGVTLETLRSDEVERGNRGAGYVAWFLDADNRDYAYSTVAHIDEAGPAQVHERTLHVPEDARTLVLALVGRDSTAKATARSMTLEVLHPSVWKTWLLAGLILAWCAALVALMLTSGVTTLPVSRAVIGALMLAILVGVALPESLSSRLPGPLANLPIHLLFKGGHFGLFFLLAAAFCAATPMTLQRQVDLFVALSILAVGTEGLQLHLVDRSTRMADIGIDTAGITLGFLVVCAIRLARRPRQSTA